MKNFAFVMSIVVVSVLYLTACVSPKSAAQAIYQIEGDYSAALSLENNYDRLPTCGSPAAPIVCKTLKTAKLVRQIDDTAWDAIHAAQTAVRTPGFGKDQTMTAVATATSAVAAFTNIVATLGVK